MEVFYLFIFCSPCVEICKAKTGINENGTFCNLILFGVIIFTLIFVILCNVNSVKYPSCLSSTKECFINMIL